MNTIRIRVVWLSIAAFLSLSGFGLLYIENRNAQAIRYEEMTLTAWALVTSTSTATPIPTLPTGTATPTPTPTPTDTPTPTPLVPKLIVHYEVLSKCAEGRPTYYILFDPSGGIPPYSYSPARPFAAKPGDFRTGVVTSTDGQSWSDYIVMPSHYCRQHTSSGWINSRGEPVADVPQCQPVNDEDRCQTE